jgi:hypothetical protein
LGAAASRALTQQQGEAFFRHRLAQQEPLAEIAAHAHQCHCVCRVLDSHGDGEAAGIVGEAKVEPQAEVEDKPAALSDYDKRIQEARLREFEARATIQTFRAEEQGGRLLRTDDVIFAAKKCAATMLRVFRELESLTLAERLDAAATVIAKRGVLREAAYKLQAEAAAAFEQLENDAIRRAAEIPTGDETPGRAGWSVQF